MTILIDDYAMRFALLRRDGNMVRSVHRIQGQHGRCDAWQMYGAIGRHCPWCVAQDKRVFGPKRDS